MIVYNDSTCTNKVFEGTADQDGSVNVTLETLANGSHFFYVKRRWDSQGIESDCYETNVDYEVIGLIVNGISSDSTPTQSKAWSWGCEGATNCEYRFAVNTNSTHTFTNEAYGATTTTTQGSGDGVYFLHVQVRDADANQYVSNVKTVSAILDNTNPTIAITTPSAGTVLNAASTTTTYTVSGTCSENSRTVSIYVDAVLASSQVGFVCDGTNFTGTIDSSIIVDGSRALSASISDEAGNSTNSAGVSITKDTVAPSLAITSSPNITAANENNYTVVGSCSENGQNVSVGIGSLNRTVSCSAGSWVTTGNDVSAQADNGTFPITASISDSAGNSTNTSVNIVKNSNVPQVSLNSASNITPSNETAYMINGTCTENGTVVNVSIGSINLTPNCSGGTWTTGFTDVSTLADNPTIAINVTHSTATPASQNVSKDTTSPEVTITYAPAISGANELNYSVSGACTENGQAVTVNIDSINLNRTCSSGSWSSGLVDVSGITDGASISITADHSTATQASTSVVKNTATPSVFSLTAPTTLTDSADLNWSMTNPGGFTVNDYEINYRQLGTSTWLTFADGTSTNVNATVTGLSASTTYEFRVRVVYDTTNYSGWSNTAQAETKPDDPLFSSPYAAMNVGGSTDTKVVAYYDNTRVYLNGTEIAGSPLSKGTPVQITTSQFDVIDADKPIYTAGRRGISGDGANRKANIVWQPTAWAGKSFSFNAIRSNPQHLFVYAVEYTTVEVKQGTTVLDSLTINAGNGGTLSWSQYGSYQVISTGTILAYHSSGNASSNYLADPKPLLPSSQEMIGFPSNSMRITADLDATNYNYIHSDSFVGSGNLNKNQVDSYTGRGSPRSFYQGHSMIISADRNISGASFADSNGYCAAPFLPTSLMRRNYAINTNSDYVAFASKLPGTIEVRDSSDNVIETLTLSRTGSNPNAPYKARRGTTTAGYRFFATVPVAAWYQPNNDVGGADQDETILYGTDE